MSDKTSQIDVSVHYHIIQGFIQAGKAPTFSELTELTQLSEDSLAQSIQRLESSHGLVCHPHDKTRLWVIHPFSTSPTATWVQGQDFGWWAPCLWCAFGIATLVNQDVIIHSRIGGESEDIDITVKNGIVQETAMFAHFAIPPKAAWDNVHHFCASLLPFCSEKDVDDWCERHNLAKGEVLPIQQLATLARLWYGQHAKPDWQKWSVKQAQEIFIQAGLTGPFWSLGAESSEQITF